MYEKEKELFRQALSEAFTMQYDRELALCEETAECTPAHTQRMQKILDGFIYHTRRERSRLWVGLLLAASLLLAGCTAYAYRDSIHGFVERFVNTYVRVSVSDNNNETTDGTLTRHYSLDYVPEGFEIISENYSAYGDQIVWQNSANDAFSFELTPAGTSTVLLDGEDGTTIVFEHNGMTIYSRTGTLSSYMWKSEGNLFIITTSISLDEDQVRLIIDGCTLDDSR